MASTIAWSYDEINNEEEERILWLKQQVFSNHLILERLVLAVHFDDLNSFRMVCRPWYMASLDRFQKDVTIVLHAPFPCWDSKRIKMEIGSSIPKIEMRELSSELEKSRVLFGLERKMFFQNCKIKYGFLAKWNKHFESCFRGWPYTYPWGDFWIEFGPQIRHLTIEYCVLSRDFISLLPKNRSPCNPKLNLESLVFNSVLLFTPGLDDPGEFITLCPRSFYSEATHLKRLVINGYLSKGQRDFYLFRCVDLQELDINVMDCHYMKRDYGELDDSPDKTEEDWPIPYLPQNRSYSGLISLNYPKLETLCLHLEPDISDHIIKLILETYADRLKTLKLSRYPFSNSPAFQTFPFTSTIFFGLTHLEFTGNLTSNFNFLRLTPSLRTLVIDVMSYGKVPCIKYDERDPLRHIQMWWQPGNPINRAELPGRVRECSQLVSYYQPFSGNMVEASDKLRQEISPFLHTNLQHLELDLALDVASLSTLAKWLPNISTLKTILNNDTLGRVCFQWPKLQHLKLLFGSAVDDNGLRGMHIKPSSSTTVEINSNLGTRLLADMDNLHHFELENLCNAPQLTDVSAQHVFLKMAKLHFLIICSAQITELAIKNLEWTIPHVKIGSHASSNKLKCCGYTQFLRQIGRLSA